MEAANDNQRVEFYHENVADFWTFLKPLNEVDQSNGGLLINTPWPLYGLIAAYIIFVCFVGPALMKQREPFKLKNLIRFYNLAEMLLAAILFFRLNATIGGPSTFVSPGHLFNLQDGSAQALFSMSNFILMIRTSEFLDTIFFTLRKKQNQITFLHVYHHAFVPFYAYWALRYAPVRFNIFILYINSFVHILMYFYYFLATFQDNNQNNNEPSSTTTSATYNKRKSFIRTQIEFLLKFKKYMTLMQISQFVVLTFYSLWPLAFNEPIVPRAFIVSNLYVALSFLALFLHFYLRIYKKQQQQPPQQTKATKQT